MANVNGKWVSVPSEPPVKNLRMPSGYHEICDFSQRVPASQKEAYDMEFRIPGGTEKFDFTYRPPQTARLPWDFTF
jgi:hypothetical protein